MKTRRARNDILSNLRKHTVESLPRQPENTFMSSHSGYSRTQTREALHAAFSRNRIEMLLTNRKDWPDALRAVAAKHTLTSLVAGTDFFMEEGAQTLKNENTFTVSEFKQGFEQEKSRLFHQYDAGISLAAFGLAETGSLVLHTGEHAPRTLSLVPPTNIVLLHEENILPDLNTYLTKHAADAIARSSNTVIVSSPSKTADIQQKLAYGAHGPKRLVVLLIESQSHA